MLLVAVLVTTLGATGIAAPSEEGFTIAAVGDIASCTVGTDEEVAAQLEEMAPEAQFPRIGLSGSSISEN